MGHAAPKSTAIMLDLAAGTGAISAAFTKKLKLVYALDISKKMLSQARNLLAEAENVRFIVANGHRTPFADGSFNLVVCRNGLHHFESPLLGLKDVRRVLKSRGTFVLIEPVAPNDLSKSIWSNLFRIRDKGRHPCFYYTAKELIGFVTSGGFVLEAQRKRNVPLSMHNWLNTGTVTSEDRSTICRIIDRLSDEMRSNLQLQNDGEKWIWKHSWSLLKLKKEDADGTQMGGYQITHN